MLFLSIGSFAQSTPLDYYVKIESANQYFQLKNYSEALMMYEDAFKNENFISQNDLECALKTARKAKNKILVCKYENLNAERKKNTDQNYKAFIDSLGKKDQQMRKEPKSWKLLKYYNASKNGSIKNVDSIKFQKAKNTVDQWLALDSLNALTLLRKIQQDGFPSERKVGLKSSSTNIVILIHFSLKDHDSLFHAIIEQALYAGDITPNIYAYMIDCQNVRHNRQQTYFQYQGCRLDEISLEEKRLVIENRKKIGLLETKSSCSFKNLPYTVD